MGYEHSACAALFGFCECDDCVADRTSKPSEPAFRESANLDEWHLWTIRAKDATALAGHRQYMMDMGFTVGPIEISQGWGASCLPQGWYYFSARIPKAALEVKDYESLCAWDRLHGELSNDKDQARGSRAGGDS
jgi:hypothetical protein